MTGKEPKATSGTLKNPSEQAAALGHGAAMGKPAIIAVDDDAEVLNACLRFAGYDDLCVNPEAYDDV